MRANTELYPPASVVGAIVLSRLGVPPGCHALDIEAVGLVTGQLDRLSSRGEYRKVIRCDICPVSISFCIEDVHFLFLSFNSFSLISTIKRDQTNKSQHPNDPKGATGQHLYSEEKVIFRSYFKSIFRLFLSTSLPLCLRM